MNISSVPTTQHTPKTVIRRSPAESTKSASLPEDSSFRNIWGISTQPSSIWSPLNGQNYGLTNPGVRPSVGLSIDSSANRNCTSGLQNTIDDQYSNRRHANNYNLPIGSFPKSANQLITRSSSGRNTSRVSTPPGFSANSVMFDNFF